MTANHFEAALYAYTRGQFSYQGASRLVRKILAECFYYDIDIVNCYPVLLWHLLSNMKADVQQKFPTLHTAAFKRKEMIGTIMVVFQCEYDKAKRLPSVLINGGSIHGSRGWCAENGLNSQHAECTIVDKLHISRRIPRSDRTLHRTISRPQNKVKGSVPEEITEAAQHCTHPL